MDGELELNDGLGYCSASPMFKRNTMPSGFEPEILSYVLITGYPSEAVSLGAAQNPFADPHLDFETIRDLDMGRFGKLSTRYYSSARGTSNELITFEVKGKTSIPSPIQSISPLTELWNPASVPGTFLGEMTFTWTLEDGTVVPAFAKSEYRIASSRDLAAPQMRVITFDLRKDLESFKQSEIIRLYDLAEWNSLSSKILNPNP